MQSDDDKLTKQLKQQLDDSTARLPPETLAALDAARHEALLQAPRKTTAPALNWRFVPAIAASVVVVMLWFTVDISRDTPSVVEFAGHESFDESLITEDFEMLEQELEFYLWLEEEPASG